MVIDYEPVFLFWAGDANDPNQMPLYVCTRVAKCQIYYTEQNPRTKFYPKKSA